MCNVQFVGCSVKCVGCSKYAVCSVKCVVCSVVCYVISWTSKLYGHMIGFQRENNVEAYSSFCSEKLYF